MNNRENKGTSVDKSVSNWAHSVDRTFSRSVDDSMGVITDSLTRTVDSSLNLFSDSMRVFTSSVQAMAGTMALPALLMSAMTGIDQRNGGHNRQSHQSSGSSSRSAKSENQSGEGRTASHSGSRNVTQMRRPRRKSASSSRAKKIHSTAHHSGTTHTHHSGESKAA